MVDKTYYSTGRVDTFDSQTIIDIPRMSSQTTRSTYGTHGAGHLSGLTSTTTSSTRTALPKTAQEGFP